MNIESFMQKFSNLFPTFTGSDIPYDFNPGNRWHPTRRRKNSPGRKRKLGAGKYMTPSRPNPERKATKPFYGGWAHSLGFKRHSAPAPTQDQVRALEKRITWRNIMVRRGKCFVESGKHSIEVPVNATLEETTDIVDEYFRSGSGNYIPFLPRK